MSERVEIYDVTTRDGDQTAGVSLSAEEKLAFAQLDDQLGVDYIEAGYAESSDADRGVFAALHDHPPSCTQVAAFGMTRRKNRTAQDDPGLCALLATQAPMLTVVGKSSRSQVRRVLQTDSETNLTMIRETFAYLRSQSDAALTFDAEHCFDGYEEDPEYVRAALQAAKENGATRLVLCDTNGGMVPEKVAAIVTDVRGHFGGTIIGMHAHNDGGLAVANTRAAVLAGARHVQVSHNAMGERTGNADLYTVWGHLKRDGFLVPPTDRLTEASRLAARIARIQQNPRQPFVGSHAFAHKGGMHISAMLRHPQSYEFVDPEDYGNRRRFAISKQSGLAVVRYIIDQLPLIPEEVHTRITGDSTLQQKLLDAIKQGEANGLKYEDAEASLTLLILELVGAYDRKLREESHSKVDNIVGEQTTAIVKVRLNGSGDVKHCVADTDGGAFDALSIALNKALEDRYPHAASFRLTDYRSDLPPSSRGGSHSPIHVWMEYTDGEDSWATTGAHTDQTKAGLDALFDAIEYGLLRHDFMAKNGSARLSRPQKTFEIL